MYAKTPSAYVHRLAWPLLLQNGMKPARRALWELLFSDFYEFHDFRQYAAENGGSAPAFKHKQTGENLW